MRNFRNIIKTFKISQLKLLGICLLIVIILITVGRDRPTYSDDICRIFREKQQWYKSANRASQRWGVPVPIMMAIMYYESGFKATARPLRTFFFIFSINHMSSAYGYAQALDGTWEIYKKETGSRDADRANFDDAIDFIGWYCNHSVIECGISKNDAYHLYLAYHEGQSGFNRKTWMKKIWLQEVAHNVQNRSNLYSSQMSSCDICNFIR